MQTQYGDRIREVRKKYNLTQEEFSKNIGVANTSLRRYEANERQPTITVLLTIAETYEVSLDWLCGLTDEATRHNKLTTYGDVFKAILEIVDSLTENNINFFINGGVDEDGEFFYNYIASTDRSICNFFSELHKMHDLLANGTIDRDIYDLWIEKMLRKDGCNFLDSGLPF